MSKGRHEYSEAIGAEEIIGLKKSDTCDATFDEGTSIIHDFVAFE